MKTKILLDTNVLVYAFDHSNQFHERSKALLFDERLELFIAHKCITEFFAVCSKQKTPLSNALKIYRSLRQNATILFPDHKSLDIFESLLQKYQPVGNRVFDLEIVAVGLASGVDSIATFNEKDFAGVGEAQLWAV